MSFLGSVFGGATNQFNPAGTTQNLQQVATANTNYGQANTGLNTLASSLEAQMNGGGPNLANQQLQNATGQNVANQAALAAGQRGAAGNVGLMARQIGQQGAGIQQQAAGQSASNVLQQQLSAQQQLAGVLGTQGQLANSNYGVAQGGVNANNQIGATIAGQNAQVNQQLLSGIGAVGSKIFGMADGGETPNNPFAQMGQPVQGGPFTSAFNFNFLNSKPAGSKPDPMAAANANAPAATAQFNQMVQPGGYTAGIPQSDAQQMALSKQHTGAKGGRVLQHFDGGGQPAPTPTPNSPSSMGVPSGVLNAFNYSKKAEGGMILPFAPQTGSMAPPGSQGLAGGGPINGEMYANMGKPVPGKAKVAGDSLQNDTVPAMLSPKEIILPRSVTLHPDAPQKAAEFVAQIKAKDGKSDNSDFREALNRSISSRKKKSA
jgi:hypothetical protein